MSNTQVRKEAPKTTTALTVKDETLNALSKRIRAMEASGDVHFPPDYSPQNALKSAWLIIQDTRDKDKRPALDVCTKASIYNALFDMVITGLNPAKKQGYFLVYGKNLVFQRSYFGSEALARRVNPDIAEIVAEPVYEGDDFEFEIVRGKKQVTKHKQSIESINSKKVKAAYAMVINHDGEVIKTDIMTFEEIKKAWAKSKVNPITDKGMLKVGSTHDDFLAEMVRKTVINRTCKPIFNSSDDKYLKIAAQRSEVIAAEDDAQEDIDAHANQTYIDIEPEPDPVDNYTGPVAPDNHPDTQNEQPEKAETKTDCFLVCPADINKQRPRKSIDYCEKCLYKMDCESYVDWAMKQSVSGQQPAEPQQQQGLDF